MTAVIDQFAIGLIAGGAGLIAGMFWRMRGYERYLGDMVQSVGETEDSLRHETAEVERLAAEAKTLRAENERLKTDNTMLSQAVKGAYASLPMWAPTRDLDRPAHWPNPSPIARSLRDHPDAKRPWPLGAGPFVDDKHPPQSSAAASRADTPAAHSGPARARPGFDADGDAA